MRVWKEGIPRQSGLLGILISLLVFLLRLVQLLALALVFTLTMMTPRLAVELGLPDHWINYGLILPFAIHNYYYGHGLMLRFNAFVRWLSKDADADARKWWNRNRSDVSW